VRLGDAALRADTITFWNICSQPLSMRGIFQNWTQLGHTGHFPFPNAVIRGFLDLFQLPLTHFTLRLPSALWGTLTVPAMYGFARRFEGPRVALMAALLMALHPYHIQFSREAYFYPPMILGVCLLMWGTVWAVQRASEEAPTPSRGYVALLVGGSFLTTYSMPGGWLTFILCAVVLLVVMFRPALRKLPVRRENMVAIGAIVLTLLPFVFASWGFKQFGGHLGGGSVREAGVKAAAHEGGNPFNMAVEYVTYYGWGHTPFRLAFGWGLVLLALAAFVYVARRRRIYLMLPVFVVGTFVLFIIARPVIGMLYEIRYVLASLPAWLLMLVLGMAHARELPLLRTVTSKGPAHGLFLLLACSAIGLWVVPAYYSTRLTGSPTPYKDIQAWVDANLPRGTPVLVDRWFEPWNELAVYPSTNVFYMFTVPSEPLDQFKNNRWRDTAQQFLARNPDAAFLEIAKSFWYVPEVGPWDWPRQYFGQRTNFTNVAGIELRKRGMAARPGFYSHHTNRTNVELFYNTPADLEARARAEGRPVFFTFGRGWAYAKLWRQLQDFRDWRVVQDAAELRVFNLRGEPSEVTMTLLAVALNGDKTVVVQGHEHTFTNGRLEPWQVGPIPLQPGENQIKVEDRQRSTAQVPLLVNEVRVAPVATGGDAAGR
jgi:hypothetical protein